MKSFVRLIIAVLGCEAIGLAGTSFTIQAIPTWYASLAKPWFAPPNWLFGPAWTVLYALMGISFSLLWNQGFTTASARRARAAFIVQAVLNGIWTPVFFGLRSPLLGFVVIVAMWAAIVVTIRFFLRQSPLAALLLLPYLLWVSFATALNAGILILN